GCPRTRTTRWRRSGPTGPACGRNQGWSGGSRPDRLRGPPSVPPRVVSRPPAATTVPGSARSVLADLVDLLSVDSVGEVVVVHRAHGAVTDAAEPLAGVVQLVLEDLVERLVGTLGHRKVPVLLSLEGVSEVVVAPRLAGLLGLDLRGDRGGLRPEVFGHRLELRTGAAYVVRVAVDANQSRHGRPPPRGRRRGCA